MFKKSLAAVAVLGAFAASSMAADVTLYGVVDYGMTYLNQETKTNVEGLSKLTTDGLTLDSGVNAASRFGIKGSEDIGNGYTISFKLENGFDADDGEMGQDGRLFGREASLTIASDWGKLSAGRMGALGSAAGSYDTVFAIGDAFDGGDGEINSMAMTGRYDNMITYQSPKVAGLQLTAQYSFKLDNKHEWPNKIGNDPLGWAEQVEGHTSADRYAGIALTGEYGAFQGVAAYEQILRSSSIPSDEVKIDDTQIFSLGGNYDFGVAKLFAMGQYYENATLDSVGFGNFATNASTLQGDQGSYFNVFLIPIIKMLGHQADGYSLHIGAQAPIFAGTLTAGVYYTDAEAFDEIPGLNVDFDEVAASVRYEYPISARTTLYSSLGYAHAEADVNGLDELNPTVKANTTQAYLGITHTF